MTVLVVAGPGNASVTAVSAELTRRGVPVARVDPQDRHVDVEVTMSAGAPRWAGTLRGSGSRGGSGSGERRLDLAEVRAVWCPAEQRSGWHRLWWGQMLTGLDAVWVNHPHAAANAGLIHQILAASRAGLRVPDTLLTTRLTNRRVERAGRYVPAELVVQAARTPARIPAGAAGEQGRVTHPTPHPSGSWSFGNGQVLQRPIDGPAREVRVVAIGAAVYAACTDRRPSPPDRPPPDDRPGPSPTRVWRFPSLPRPRSARAPEDPAGTGRRESSTGTWCAGIERAGYTREPLAVPDEVAAGVRQMLAALGLTYAVLSFAVDPDGRWWFLRLDAAADLVLIEFGTGLPLTAAMATCLEGHHHVA